MAMCNGWNFIEICRYLKLAGNASEGSLVSVRTKIVCACVFSFFAGFLETRYFTTEEIISNLIRIGNIRKINISNFEVCISIRKHCTFLRYFIRDQ